MGSTQITAGQISNLDFKQAVKVLENTNISLASGAPNIVDGVSVNINDRILVVGQGDARQNGLYDVTVVGTGSNGTWVRTRDGNTTGEINAGMLVTVTEGTVYADTIWMLTTNDPIVIDATALNFREIIANGVYGNSNVASYLTTYIGNIAAGNISITGNLYTSANIVTNNISPLSMGNIYHTGNLLPAGNTYNLGLPTVPWQNAFFGSNSITILDTFTGNVANSVTIENNAGNISLGTAGFTIGELGNNTPVFTIQALTGQIYSNANTIIQNATNAANTTTGSLRTLGGAGIAKDLYVGGKISVTGNVTANNVNAGNVVANLTYNTNTLGFQTNQYLTLNTLNGAAFIGDYSNDGGTQILNRVNTSYIKFSTANQQNSIRINDNGSHSDLGSVGISLAKGTANYTFAQNGLSFPDNSLQTTAWTGNVAGANVVGSVANATYAISAGTVTTNAQPNITSVGTLTSVTSTGNIFGGAVSATGNITGSYIIGNGSQLIGIPAGYSNSNAASFLAAFGSNVISTTGTITSGNITGGNVLSNGIVSVAGNVYITGNLSVAGNINVVPPSYGQFANLANITATTSNKDYPVLLSTSLANSSISLGTGTSNSRIIVSKADTYRVQYDVGIQISGGTPSVYFWLRKNGVDIPYSQTSVAGTNNTIIQANGDFIVTMAVNDYIELYWATSMQNQATLVATAAQTTPFACPASPSVIVTLTPVSA
jgi:hypothetical protein